jgi:hypothetical protein
MAAAQDAQVRHDAAAPKEWMLFAIRDVRAARNGARVTNAIREARVAAEGAEVGHFVARGCWPRFSRNA